MRSPFTIFLLTALLAAVASGRLIAMPEAPSTTSQMPQPKTQNPNTEGNTYASYLTFSFYVHEIGTGPNQTVWNVAYSEKTLHSSTSFGLIQMVDNIITSEAEPDSLALGRVQGTVTYADLRETAVSVNWNFIFAEETPFAGSTVNVQGRLPITDSWREWSLSVVGGTGMFWTARGIAFSTSTSFDPSTRNRVSFYTLYMTRPDMILSRPGISA